MINYFDLNGAKTFLNKIRDEFNTEGFKIDDGNLSYTEKNEIIISGLNATKNDSGTVDGVTISGGKVILSPDALGKQDIKLEKASGIYSGYEIELEAGTELTPYAYTPSILSASSGNVTYQTHSQSEGYIFDSSNSSISYGDAIPQLRCSIKGLQDSLTVDNGTVSGLDFDYDSVTISADAVTDSKTVTIKGDDMTFFANATATISLYGSNSKLYSTGDNSSLEGSDRSSTINNEGENVTIHGIAEIFNNADHVTLGMANESKRTNGGSYCSIHAYYKTDISILGQASYDTIFLAYGDSSVSNKGRNSLFVVDCQTNAISGRTYSNTIQGFSDSDSITIPAFETCETSLGGGGVNVKYSNTVSSGKYYGSVFIKNFEATNFHVNNEVVTIPPFEGVEGGETFNNSKAHYLILGAADTTVNNSASHVSIQSGRIINTGDYSSLAGVGVDTITNSADFVTIDAGINTDIVINEGTKVLINAGDANDSIYLTGVVDDYTVAGTAADCTIVGGAGNDSIWSNGNGHTYRFTKGDGKDTIYGFGDNEVIQAMDNVSGSTLIYNTTYSNVKNTQTVDGQSVTEIDYEHTNMLIKIGTGSILLRELPVGRKVRFERYNYGDFIGSNFVDSNTYVVPRIHIMSTLDGAFANTIGSISIQGSTANDTISNTADFVTINGGTGNDSINNSGTNTTYIYNTSSGADTITGFNQATDLIYVKTADTAVTFAANSDGVLVSIGTDTTVLLDGVSSGNIRYKIADGEIQTYTIS